MTHQAELLLHIRVGLSQEIGHSSPLSHINRIIREIRELGNTHGGEIEVEDADDYSTYELKDLPAEPRHGDGDAYEERIGRETFLAFRRAIMDADRAFQQDGAASTKTWMREYVFPALDKEGVRLLLQPLEVETEMKTVTFVHEKLWKDFLAWLDSRGLNVFPFPSDLQPASSTDTHYGIGIVTP